MFYERLNQLCAERGIKLTNLIRELGMSSGNMSRWKNGTVPKSSVIATFAQYFGVTSDYLLGRTDERTVPDEKLEGIDFALSGEIKALSENEKQDLLDYIRFKRQQREGR